LAYTVKEGLLVGKYYRRWWLAVENREVSLVKVTRKGQVTIPRGTRERLGIREGDYLVATEVKDLVLLRKASMPSWDDLFKYGEKFAIERGITQEDVLKAIRAVRRGD
jgi:AbrB family looped-hinge helix DNA binding protein